MPCRCGTKKELCWHRDIQDLQRTYVYSILVHFFVVLVLIRRELTNSEVMSSTLARDNKNSNFPPKNHTDHTNWNVSIHFPWGATGNNPRNAWPSYQITLYLYSPSKSSLMKLGISEHFTLSTMMHHRRQTPTPGTLCPTFCEQCVSSFTSHRIMKIEGLWEGAYGLSSLSEKTKESNHLQMSLQRQALSPQLF